MDVSPFSSCPSSFACSVAISSSKFRFMNSGFWASNSVFLITVSMNVTGSSVFERVSRKPNASWSSWNPASIVLEMAFWSRSLKALMHSLFSLLLVWALI